MSATHCAGPELLLRALVRHIEVHRSACTHRTRPKGGRRYTVERLPGRRNRGSGAPLDAAGPLIGRRVCGSPAPNRGSVGSNQGKTRGAPTRRRGRRAGPQCARTSGRSSWLKLLALPPRPRTCPSPGLHSYVLGPPTRSHGGDGHIPGVRRASRRPRAHAYTHTRARAVAPSPPPCALHATSSPLWLMPGTTL